MPQRKIRVSTKAAKAAKAAEANPVALPVSAVESAAAELADNLASGTDRSDRSLAREAARVAVAAYYSGLSMPFKAACDLQHRAPVHSGHRATTHTRRTAAGIAAILAYCEINPDGSFVRGSGRLPGKLLGLTGADAKRMLAAGPESGILTQLISRGGCEHISGPLHGRGCDASVFRLNFTDARTNMLAFNDALPENPKQRVFSAPLRLLGALLKRAESSTSEPDNSEPDNSESPFLYVPAPLGAPAGDSVPDYSGSDNNVEA